MLNPKLVRNLAAAAALLVAPVGLAQTLTMAQNSNPLTLDPNRTFNGLSFSITNQVYENLVYFGSDGVIQPRLAEARRRRGPEGQGLQAPLHPPLGQRQASLGAVSRAEDRQAMPAQHQRRGGAGQFAQARDGRLGGPLDGLDQDPGILGHHQYRQPPS